MLTESRVKKVLDLVKKEYDYMDNKPIDILVERLGKWCTETNINSYTLILDKKNQHKHLSYLKHSQFVNTFLM